MVKQNLINLLRKSDQPLSVAEILKKISANKTTIYRELDDFIKEGKVMAVEFGDGKKRYEIAEKHHHHMICKLCGKIEDIEIDESRFLNSIKNKNFEVESHSIEFFGKCINCK